MHHRTGFTEQQFGTWPTNDGQTCSAVMRKNDRFGEFRRDVEGSFQEIFDQVAPEIGDQLRTAATRVENFRPIRYPDNFYRISHGPGWALVGDAGYHKDPFTGWGITDAFMHAELLAEQLHLGPAGERPMADALADYAKRPRRAEQRRLRIHHARSGRVGAHPQLPRLGVPRGQPEPRVHLAVLHLIGGGISGEEFFAPENLEALYEEVDFPQDRRLLTHS